VDFSFLTAFATRGILIPQVSVLLSSIFARIWRTPRSVGLEGFYPRGQRFAATRIAGERFMGAEPSKTQLARYLTDEEAGSRT
jgi:hypothetical protein